MHECNIRPVINNVLMQAFAYMLPRYLVACVQTCAQTATLPGRRGVSANVNISVLSGKLFSANIVGAFHVCLHSVSLW